MRLCSAWEADTLPAELLPLGADRVIADRARAAGGTTRAVEPSDILRKRQTLDLRQVLSQMRCMS